MRFPALLLLIGLLALGLYFPARLLTRAQQAGTVNVRPRITSTQAGMPEVKATVNRNRVPAGEEVTFTLSPARVVTDSRYRVTLFFGDGKQKLMRQAKISHPYLKSGTYTYSILVELEKQPTPAPTPTPIPAVKLDATPTVVEVNQQVSFSAQLSRRYPNIKYRFVFADGSDTGWQDKANASHSYRSPNTYKAYVDIGILSNGAIKQAGGSQREAIKVTESPTVNASVKLSANPTSIETGKPVTLTARSSPQSASARYRFDFGDQSPRTDWQASSQTTHRYKSAGKYSARVEVRGLSRSSPSTPGDSVTIEVSRAPSEKSTVDLTVSPSSVLVGIPVFFQAVPSGAGSNARYRFNFGDGSSTTAWSSNPYQTHAYSAGGRYPAYVEMAESGNEPAAASGKKRVNVTAIGFTNNTNDNRNNNRGGNANSNSTPRTNVNANNNGNANVAGNQNSNGKVNANTNTASNTNAIGGANANTNVNGNRNANGNLNSNNAGNRNVNASNNSPSPSASEVIPSGGETDPGDWWWIYLVIAAIILFAGYQAYSYFYVPRPTFVPHADLGDSNVGADSPLEINLQMDVDPNVSGGEFNIDTEGNNLIKSQRTEP